MPVTDIKEIRILPALAAGRFGSSPEPMVNYEVQANPNDTVGFQQLVPAETLVVDLKYGRDYGRSFAHRPAQVSRCPRARPPHRTVL